MNDDDDDLEWEEEPDEVQEPAQEESRPEPQDTGVEQEDPEVLKHKISSAEGRLKKFEESLDDMRQQLSALESSEPEAEDEKNVDDTPALPEGWTPSDWDDFSTDNPVEAELISTQSRQLKSLQDKVESVDQQAAEREAIQQFRSTVLSVHPDYDDLIGKEREQIQAFIANQANPLIKEMYEQVYQSGSAEQVCELVNQYKSSKSDGDDRRQSVDESLAVPSHSPVPDSNRVAGLPAADDEDAAWDFFPDDAI